MLIQIGRAPAMVLIGNPCRPVFASESPRRVEREQHDQQQARSDAGEEQSPERLLGRDRVQDHRDRRRQQDAERAAGSDDACRETRRVAALAHFRNARAADRGTGCRARSRHRRKQRASEHVGNPEAPRNALHPRMHRQIQVAAGVGAADRGPLENEQRDRQQRDARHFLVHVLGHGIERCSRHEDVHEGHGYDAQCKCDRHAGKHYQQCDYAE